ncbi:MAG: M20/M25/M40 family metallo-hydrolase, partial [Candidatus Thermoplasmatota archaeon]|nr:M20/M25/M40 family metallo-hydrolase [Candidatus Thermoplasmatota archaeon]
MKKILCLIFCMFMIVNIFNVMGFSVQTLEINNLYYEQSRFQAPPPGELQTPLPELIDEPITQKNIEITSANFEDIVIGMLEQVDESIYLSYLENITSFGPRRTGTSACVAAAEYIYNQFESMELDVRYHHWSNGGYTSDNVEATLNGTDETSDEIYIVCAHYDTVSGSPGADDDGSGTVAVLTAAYIMSQYQFNHTIKFVTFSGEEQGLLGSKVYAQQAKAQGWNIKGVLNADMISYAVTTNDGNNLIVYENTASEWLYAYTYNINNEYNDYIHLTLHHGGSIWGSDHNSFWDQGYNALFYFEYTETPYYHTSGDTIDHINATYAVKNVRLILATLAELAGPGFPSNPPNVPVITGPTMVTINEVCKYSVVTTDPDGDDVYYYVDWGDGNFSGWIGPYTSGVPIQTSHTWTSLGSYMVRVKAKDIYGVRSSWSDYITVIVSDNRPPNAPIINGPNRGKVGVTYEYEISSTDPDGHGVYFFVFWGDGDST